MSRSLVAADPVPSADGPRPPVTPRRRFSRRRRSHGPVSRAWVLTHRWTSLVLGLVLLVELTTGAILLYHAEIDQALNPQRYQATASATPMPLLDAMRQVQAEYPDLDARYAYRNESGTYEISGEGTPTVFIDPGTGGVIDVGQSSPWILKLMVNVHDCALTCEGYPGYQAWLATPLPAVNDHITVGGLILGVLGVLLLFLVVSGVVIWWPGLRGWITGFVVRRGKGPYIRDLDLHRVVGIIAVPFLFMWGFTGAAFEFTWPEAVYFAVLPGESTPDPELTHGDGPLIPFEEAIATAQAQHPEMVVVGVYENTPTEPEGSYGVSLETPGQSGYGYIEVDSHGGGFIDYYPNAADVPITQEWWDDGVLYELHFGSIVGGWWRIVWLVFGVAPVLLGITGITIWLTKRRSTRNRAAARRRRVMSAGEAPGTPAAKPVPAGAGKPEV